MTFVETIVHQMPQISKPRISFLIALFHSFACFVGRATMVNLSRFGAGSPRRLYRWYSKPFDWPTLNWTALEHAGVTAQPMAAAIDCTFLPKSGSKTWGLGKFHCGTTGRAQRGLEACVIGLLALEQHTAFTIAAEQTPAQFDNGDTRVDFYVRCLLGQQQGLLAHGVRHVVADGYFAKKKVFDALAQTELDAVTKLRSDTNLRYLYEGPRKPGRGRPKRYDGKVHWDDLTRFESTDLPNENVQLKWAKLNSPHYKCDLLVVVVLWEVRGKVRRKILCTTDMELAPEQVYRLYKMRFQQEFVFRDGKQFVGLADGQMRDQQKRKEHLNASLCALNMMRLEQMQGQPSDQRKVISMASFKRRKYAQYVAQRIYSHLALEAEHDLIPPSDDDWASLGLFAS